MVYRHGGTRGGSEAPELEKWLVRQILVVFFKALFVVKLGPFLLGETKKKEHQNYLWILGQI